MKHYANAQGIHCPVNCPVCHYNGRVFPARFRRILLPAAGTIDRITNKSNHVIFLLDGAVHISQGCNSVYLKAGQCMFLPRNASPDIQATKVSDVVWLDFSNRIVLGGHDVLARIAMECVQELEESDNTLPILGMTDTMCRTLSGMQAVDSPCWHLLWHYELYLQMVSGYTTKELALFFRPILQANDDFRAFVTDNYEMGDSLDDIARKANLSKSYFFQRFKQTFGMTAHQWLMKQKEQKFLRMITSGQTDSKVLADKFGFKTQAGLYLFCRRHFDCSFSELKRQHKQKNHRISRNRNFCAKNNNF